MCQVGFCLVLCSCPCDVFVMYQPRTPPLAPSVRCSTEVVWRYLPTTLPSLAQGWQTAGPRTPTVCGVGNQSLLYSHLNEHATMLETRVVRVWTTRTHVRPNRCGGVTECKHPRNKPQLLATLFYAASGCIYSYVTSVMITGHSMSLGARVPRNEWEHFRNISGSGSILLHCNQQTHLWHIWNVLLR